MSKTRLKIGFFQSQIQYILELQQQLEQIRNKLKEAIMQAHANSNVNTQARTISEVNFRYKNLIDEIKEESKSIKMKSDLFLDESRYQGEVMFKSLEEKVDDLNERLYRAEQGVQRAENIKKAMDPQKNQYKMSNTINFKSIEKSEVINKYIEAEQKIKNQFKRGINLIMKTNDRISKRCPTTEFQKQLKMAALNKNFCQIKRVQNFELFGRKSRSQQKNIPFDHQNFPNSFRRQPLLCILTKSPHLKYKKFREMSLQDLVTKLRENNKKQTIINKNFQKALELKSRNQVLKFLQSKQTLNEEESIMKLQLMSEKLNQFAEEKLLSLKLGKKSKQFEEKVEQSMKYIGMKKKSSKSVEKLEIMQQRKSKLKKSSTKAHLMKQFREQFASYASNQKTTDSLN